MAFDNSLEQDRTTENVVDKNDVNKDMERLNAELAEARREKDQFLAMAQRAQADFINYKRRVEEERKELEKYAKSNLLLKVLNVLDDFQRALAHLPQEDMPPQWLEGVRLIRRKLELFLESEGVSKLDVIGKNFNPGEHEALSFEDSSEEDNGKIISVIREGYKLHNRVLRPAQVTVGRNKQDTQN